MGGFVTVAHPDAGKHPERLGACARCGKRIKYFFDEWRGINAIQHLEGPCEDMRRASDHR